MGVSVCACVTSGVWCIPSVVDWYVPSEASESKIADCPGRAVFTCARNSPVVFFNVLFMGVTVCTCVMYSRARQVCTVCSLVATETALAQYMLRRLVTHLQETALLYINAVYALGDKLDMTSL